MNWEAVPDFEDNYLVSDCGQMFSVRKNKLMKFKINHQGYQRVRLTDGNSQVTLCVHQIVAMAFLGHVRNGHKLVVDHIDNDNKNNHVSNLQIVTQKQNIMKNPRPKTKIN